MWGRGKRVTCKGGGGGGGGGSRGIKGSCCNAIIHLFPRLWHLGMILQRLWIVPRIGSMILPTVVCRPQDWYDHPVDD